MYREAPATEGCRGPFLGCTCVCACMSVCECLHTGAHKHGYTFVWKSEDNLRNHPPWFQKQSHWPRTQYVRLGSVCLSVPPRLGITSMYYHTCWKGTLGSDACKANTTCFSFMTEPPVAPTGLKFDTQLKMTLQGQPWTCQANVWSHVKPCL